MARKRREVPGGGPPPNKPVRVRRRRTQATTGFFPAGSAKPKGKDFKVVTPKIYSFQPGGTQFSSIDMPAKYKRATRIAKNRKPKNYKRFRVG